MNLFFACLLANHQGCFGATHLHPEVGGVGLQCVCAHDVSQICGEVTSNRRALGVSYGAEAGGEIGGEEEQRNRRA
jgi:hypothetical protein